MLASIWPASRDPAGYLVSEKLDGVRAYWDGQQLRFRSGLPIAAPLWFTAALPKVPLDGELWLGRHQFDRLSGVVRKDVPVDAEWRELRYMVFDLPGAPGSFSQRVQDIHKSGAGGGAAVAAGSGATAGGQRQRTSHTTEKPGG
jgi:DNA ligase-1